MTDKTFEDEARDIGAEHGTAAGSWCVDGNSSVENLRSIVQASEDGEFWDIAGGISAPLSGEWADGYSINQLFEDIGLTADGLDGGTDLGGGLNDGVFSAYEDAYYSAYEAEAVRSARGMLPDETNGS